MMCGNAPLFSSGKHQELGIHPFIQSLPGPRVFFHRKSWNGVMSDMSLGKCMGKCPKWHFNRVISWSSIWISMIHCCCTWIHSINVGGPKFHLTPSPRLSTIAQAKKKNKATLASHANRQFQRWREDDYIEKNMAARSCHGCLVFRVNV